MLTHEGGRSLRLAGREITDDGPCYVIAEIGHNHQGSLDTAKQLFAAAKEAGADAVKLQKRDNRSLFCEDFFNKPYDNENSFGPTYGAHREALEFGLDEYTELRDYAEELDLDFFATAFDCPSVDFLEEIEIPAYKVGSADIDNVPLLRYLAQTGRPVIFSTGGATLEEVERAYEILSEGTDDIGILQCTASYPVPWEELDLRVIETYRERFPSAIIGLSAHDNGIAMAVAAYVLGARIVEKHFTLDRAMRGTDHKFSLEPQGLQKMVRDLERLQVALGDGSKKTYESEVAPLTKMSKKLVAARPLEAGHVLGPGDIAVKSPGDGMSPSEFDLLVGARLVKPMAADAAFSLDLLEDLEAVPADRIDGEPALAVAAVAATNGRVPVGRGTNGRAQRV